MILVIYLLTPFTMTHNIHLFQGFRIIQTRMMVLAVLHGLRPNQKLKSILEGCTDLTHLWRSTLHAHNLFSRPFFQSQSVYIRFTHIVNMQPKFYIGSAMHHTLDREHGRSRKYLQLTNERLVPAELALRYWREHDNLYIWAPIPIYTDRADYRSLEMAIIQEWQPRLNYPFICQFFHPRKGILQKPALNTTAQFGLATLWRRAKHKFTPQLVRQILSSARFQTRLELWTIIHALGSNTKARFEQTNMLRSNDGGLTLCYALRRLANNIQEPFRTLSLNAIDASIKWWNGKPAPRATALRAPWSLTPNLQLHLKRFLRKWHLQVLAHQVPCYTPSFKMVFIKHAAVLDQLCNHKQAIADWSMSNPAVCCCKNWGAFKAAALNPSDPHWVLAGSLLHSLAPAELAVIAEGSLMNKVFPSKKEYQNQMRLGMKSWTKRNGLPSMPIPDISDLCQQLWSEQCIRQCRGSPMGSPLSPALCLMVVSISEQIWSINFKQILSNHNLFIRHIRYVDNRLIFGDARRKDLPPYEVLLDDGFYGKPIIPETEPDQEFLGFMLETKPLELIYQGPTNVSQVLSPFSVSPPKVLLSGFRSRCHIVVKGAFPKFRIRQGLDQLIHFLLVFPRWNSTTFPLKS